jgi:hypothetical protein
MRVDLIGLYQKIDAFADAAIANYRSTSDHYYEGQMDAYGQVLTMIEEVRREMTNCDYCSLPAERIRKTGMEVQWLCEDHYKQEEESGQQV